jgi:formate dehydrogenase maturation protein FdhE
VVRYNHANYRDRWSLLYREFEQKYHINLQSRLDTYNEKNKTKLKNKIEYIEKVMNKIPELYEIAAKLFENDVKALVTEMYETIA